jgi:CheY-like chemotaxis protein
MEERLGRPDCIIVADGEVLVRSAISEYLRHCGYKVIEAASVDEVIDVVEAKTTPVDAILCDAGITGSMNAFDLRLRIRNEQPQIEVVLAGNVDAVAKAAGKMCDQGPHLQRPYDPEAVVNHIKMLMATARGKQP